MANSQAVGLRDTLESQGYKVGWDANTGKVTVNDKAIDTSGMTNVNGRYQATSDQISNVLKNAGVTTGVQPVSTSPTPPKATSSGASAISTPAVSTGMATSATPQQVEVRKTLEQQGYEVGWDPNTGGVSVAGMPISTQGMQLVDGRYMATPEQIQNALQQGQVYGTNPLMNQSMAEAKQYGLTFEPQNRGQVLDLINSIGTFKPSYRQQIEDLFSNVINKPYVYNPSEDKQLQLAKADLSQSVNEAMNSRGILNSTITKDETTKGYTALEAQFEANAWNRHQQELSNALQQAGFLKDLDESDFNSYIADVNKTLNIAGVLENLDNQDLQRVQSNTAIITDIATQKLNEKKAEIDALDKAIQRAWQEVDELGYVSNEASQILGVEAGTPSKSVREMAQQHINDMEAARQQIDYKIWETKYNGEITLTKTQMALNARANGSGSSLENGKISFNDVKNEIGDLVESMVAAKNDRNSVEVVAAVADRLAALPLSNSQRDQLSQLYLSRDFNSAAQTSNFVDVESQLKGLGTAEATRVLTAEGNSIKGVVGQHYYDYLVKEFK